MHYSKWATENDDIFCKKINRKDWFQLCDSVKWNIYRSLTDAIIRLRFGLYFTVVEKIVIKVVFEVRGQGLS